MEYAIIYILNDNTQHMTNTFTRYQDAKRSAKELSKRPDILSVWIEGYENIIDKDLNF